MAQPIETLSYEDALKELDTLVDTLNKGNLTLEETMAAYERGVGLALHGQALLTKAQGTLEKIEGDLVQAFALEDDHDPIH